MSRSFDVGEGFVSRENRPEFDKGLDNFEPRMIALQKQYAHDLLTHVNSYIRPALQPRTGGRVRGDLQRRRPVCHLGLG